MSDDTPTQRYPEGFPIPDGQAGQAPQTPQPGSDAPTERFDATMQPDGTVQPAAAVPPAGTVPPASTPPSGDGGERKQRGLLIGLGIAAGALLLALIGVLIWVAVSAGSPSPEPTASDSSSPSPTPTESESPTPTPTPTESTTPTPAPPAPDPAPEVIVSYTTSARSVDCTSGNPVPVTFNWNTTGSSVNFAIGSEFADTAPYQTGLPAVGGITVDYQCGQASGEQVYSIAVFHNSDVIGRQTIVITE